MATTEGVAIESAKPSFGENLKELAGIAKEAALERLGDLGGRAGEFVKNKWEKISGKTAEWISDIGDSLKLQTVDRWKMATKGVLNNTLIALKEGNISSEEKKVGVLDGKITTEEGRKNKVEADFSSLMTGVEGNPALQAIIEKDKAIKLSENDSNLAKLNAKKEESAKKQEAYSNDIENFKKKLEKVEGDFGAKVDGRIDRIKTRDNYEDNKVHLETVEGSISRLTARVSKTEKELAQYEGVLKQGKLLGKEAKNELKRKIEIFKDFLNNSEKHLERAEELKAKYEKQIAKTDKRVASLEKFKGKYVGKKEKVAKVENTDTDSSGKEGTTVEPLESSGGLDVESEEDSGGDLEEEDEGQESKEEGEKEALEEISNSVKESEKKLGKEGEGLKVNKLADAIAEIRKVIEKNIEKISEEKANQLKEVNKYLEDFLKRLSKPILNPALISKEIFKKLNPIMKNLIENN